MSPSKTSQLAQLRQTLVQLKKNAGLAALKAGTEVEDMTFQEIGLLRKLTAGILPLFVKIGGPEARNDMRACAALAVDGLIAPMVESVFALEKFISSARQTLSQQQYNTIERGINLETVTAFQHLDEILGSAAASELHQITAARSDLSASMHRQPEDTTVIRACSEIVQQSRRMGWRTSVGGSILPSSAANIIEKITPDWINTRHMVVQCRKLDGATVAGDQLARSIEQCLQFEVQLYDLWAGQNNSRSSMHAERARIIERRLQQSTLLHT